MSTKDLIEAADAVDVIDLAGAIIANPSWRAPMTSTAGIVALAHAVEAFWAVALEAEVLARALALTVAGPDETAVRDHAIRAQTETILTMMNALRRTEETSR